MIRFIRLFYKNHRHVSSALVETRTRMIGNVIKYIALKAVITYYLFVCTTWKAISCTSYLVVRYNIDVGLD